MTMTMQPDDQDQSPKSNAYYELEIEKIKEKRTRAIDHINKTANAAQQRDALALDASGIDFTNDPEANKKADELLARLPHIPLVWDEEKGERPEVCGLLFADFTIGKLQYNTNQPIERSPEIQPMRILKLLMQKQPVAVTYEEIAQELGLTSEGKKFAGIEISIPVHQRFGDEIRDSIRQVKNLLSRTGINKKEIKYMIISRPKQGFALRCGS